MEIIINHIIILQFTDTAFRCIIIIMYSRVVFSEDEMNERYKMSIITWYVWTIVCPYCITAIYNVQLLKRTSILIPKAVEIE